MSRYKRRAKRPRKTKGKTTVNNNINSNTEEQVVEAEALGEGSPDENTPEKSDDELQALTYENALAFHQKVWRLSEAYNSTYSNAIADNDDSEDKSDQKNQLNSLLDYHEKNINKIQLTIEECQNKTHKETLTVVLAKAHEKMADDKYELLQFEDQDNSAEKIKLLTEIKQHYIESNKLDKSISVLLSICGRSDEILQIYEKEGLKKQRNTKNLTAYKKENNQILTCIEKSEIDYETELASEKPGNAIEIIEYILDCCNRGTKQAPGNKRFQKIAKETLEKIEKYKDSIIKPEDKEKLEAISNKFKKGANSSEKSERGTKRKRENDDIQTKNKKTKVDGKEGEKQNQQILNEAIVIELGDETNSEETNNNTVTTTTTTTTTTSKNNPATTISNPATATSVNSTPISVLTPSVTPKPAGSTSTTTVSQNLQPKPQNAPFVFPSFTNSSAYGRAPQSQLPRELNKSDVLALAQQFLELSCKVMQLNAQVVSEQLTKLTGGILKFPDRVISSSQKANLCTAGASLVQMAYGILSCHSTHVVNNQIELMKKISAFAMELNKVAADKDLNSSIKKKTAPTNRDNRNLQTGVPRSAPLPPIQALMPSPLPANFPIPPAYYHPATNTYTNRIGFGQTFHQIPLIQPPQANNTQPQPQVNQRSATVNGYLAYNQNPTNTTPTNGVGTYDRRQVPPQQNTQVPPSSTSTTIYKPTS